jgi:predicted Zn-dependent peptidase
MTIVFEKRKLPVVSVAFAVRSGGINESSEEKGISHFIEHLLYKGTSSRSAQKIAEEIEKKGGDLNGFTDELVTAYWCKMPSKHLDVALDVLSDMVKNPLFERKEIEKERRVIFDEIKMRKDNPIVYVFDKLQGCLYKEPFGVPLIGTEKTMNSLNREKIIKKFKEVYQPNNMILSVVGNADFDSLVNFVEKNFGNKKGKLKNFKIGLHNVSKSEKRKGIDQANLAFSFHVPLLKEKNSLVSKVLITHMAGGMSSRLFQEIREKRNLAYAIKGDAEINKHFAYGFVYIGTTKENLEKVKKLILEEFEKVANDLTEKDLEEVKDQLIGNYQISMEDSQSQMINLLVNELDGNAKDFYDFEKKISKIKLEEVKDLAKKALKKHSFFELLPG